MVMGMSAGEFWKLTPWQFYRANDAYADKVKLEQNSLIYAAWIGEIFHRTKKLSGKDLKRFIGDEDKAEKKIDGNAIMQRLKAYQNQRENAKSS